MRRTDANRQSLADKTWKESFPDEASLSEHEKKKRVSRGGGNMLDIRKYTHILGHGHEQKKPARQLGWQEDGKGHEEEQQYPSPESMERLQDIIRRKREGRIERAEG